MQTLGFAKPWQHGDLMLNAAYAAWQSCIIRCCVVDIVNDKEMYVPGPTIACIYCIEF